MTQATAGIDFFPNLLNLISNAFTAKYIAIVECLDKQTQERTKALVLVQLNEHTRKIEFYPIARLYDSNPMHGIEMVNGGAVLASQIPMSEWARMANEKPADLLKLN